MSTYKKRVFPCDEVLKRRHSQHPSFGKDEWIDVSFPKGKTGANHRGGFSIQLCATGVYHFDSGNKCHLGGVSPSSGKEAMKKIVKDMLRLLLF